MNKVALALLLTTTACSSIQNPYQSDVAAAQGGIVIAEATYAPANTRNKDCNGPSVSVISSFNGGMEINTYGVNNTRCQPAQVLFDGENPMHTRPPALGIQLAFKDDLSSQPKTMVNNPEPVYLDITPTQATTIDFADSPRTPQITHSATVNGNDFAAKARRWAVLEQSERMLADIRDMERMSANPTLLAHQDKILELQAQIRNLESTNQALQNAKLDKQITADELQQQLRNIQAQTNAREDELYNEREELQRRLAQFEAKNYRMAERNAERERALTQKLVNTEQSLQSATVQAEAARRELVLEAAQRIAEAERLAFAARMAEKEALAQEAARKRAESDVLLDRALGLQNGKSVIVPAIADQLGRGQETNPLPVPFEDLPIAMSAENVTLQELLDKVLTQAAKHAGDWRASWQLAPSHQYILAETWSLTAEATVGEVLAFIKTRLLETHNILITFERFDKVKLLVATDGGEAATQPAVQ